MARRSVAIALLATGALAAGGCARGSADEAVGRTGPSGTGTRTGDEFASPITVSARLALTPVVGQTAELTIEVASEKSYERASITIELPRNLDFVALPSGVRRLAEPSPNPARGGPQAAGPLRLAAGGRHRLRLALLALRSGRGELAVFVNAPISGGIDGGADYAFVVVP